jgi:hypothetical protein
MDISNFNDNLLKKAGNPDGEKWYDKLPKGIHRISYLLTDEQKKFLYQKWLRVYRQLAKQQDIKEMDYWKHLLRWAWHNENETHKIDPKKPIGLINNITGTGKTHSMKTLSILIKQDRDKDGQPMAYIRDNRPNQLKFDVISSLEIYAAYQKDGLDGLYPYEIKGGLCIDDLGEEPTFGNYYGDKISVLGYLLKRRFDAGLWTHWTTNVTLDRLGEKYGNRVYSRLKGETNIINIVSEKEDLRIKNAANWNSKND